jgi:luciferase family oxidoreductase group 1
MPALSILDLVPIVQGSNPGAALANALDLARHAERLGYTRYWIAEHHNMVGIGGAATSVVIGHIAGGTKTIRVGSGGIMLPNHAPMIIAEQFGTLASLYPGRIDLGLGRAPGTDGVTLRALRRHEASAERFPQDVLELQAFLGPAQPGQPVIAVPGAGTEVPIWILGSSLFGAQLAAALGLPFAFASHFAPDALMHALAIYRERFKPSAQLAKPYAMIGVNVVAADTTASARHLFTSLQQAFANMVRGTRGRLQPPIDDIEAYWTPMEKAHAQSMLTHSYVGDAKTLTHDLSELARATGADEFIVSSAIFEHDARIRSFEILAGIKDALGSAQPMSLSA